MGMSRRVPLRAMAGAAAGLSWPAHSLLAARPPPETKRIHLSKVPSIRLSPMDAAETLMRGEGFKHVAYVETMAGGGLSSAQRMGAGQIDLGMNVATPLVLALDIGPGRSTSASSRSPIAALSRSIRSRPNARDERSPRPPTAALPSPSASRGRRREKPIGTSLS